MKMHNHILLGVFGVCLTLMGCSSEPRHIEPCADFSPAQIINDGRVLTDESFDAACYIARMGQEVLPPYKRWQYKLLLANKTYVPQKVYYMMTWYDKNGDVITRPSPAWLSTTVLTGEYKEIRMAAPTEEARDFKLYLQGRYDTESKELAEELREEE